MKKILNILIFAILIITLTGCSKSAKMTVEEYLDRYNSLDAEVLNDMNDIVNMENMSDDDKETYTAIFKKQYADLQYKVLDEEYDGDEAIIKVKISVYDYYKVQRDASVYLANNADEFNDENGIYDSSKFIKYKLEKMKMTTDKVDYTIDFYVVKNDNKWIVSSLSNADLEKIHGIYNYES